MKTVYVLGAGTSKDAGFPSQSELLPAILSPRSTRGLSQVEQRAMFANRRKILSFLQRVFHKDIATLSQVSLEDILTIIDRAMATDEVVHGYDSRALERVRSSIVDSIKLVFESRMGSAEWRRLTQWAGALTLARVEAGQRADPFAVISTNWDISLDVSLEMWATAFRVLARSPEHPDIRGPSVDYCAYTYPIDENAQYPPSLQLKARGFYNLKLIKPHGSFNWQTCTNCGRLFVTTHRTSSAALLNIVDVPRMRQHFSCRKCSSRPRLSPLIVTPTFLKDLANAHLRSVWQNALIELSEAKRVVFCGYSFPEADYEFRYLLAKGVQADAEVEVYLKAASRQLSPREQAEQARYVNFFGRGRCEVSFTGFEGLVKRAAPPSALTTTRLESALKVLRSAGHAP